MIYTYNELLESHKLDYQIKKALQQNKLFKIEKGIYSNQPFPNPLEIITKKYPSAIFTMDSAFYFHGLTDVIPSKNYLAVKRDSIRIRDSGVIQIFMLERLLEIGKIQMNFDAVTINVYDKERMLIELVRAKKRMAFDYYKEIIISYRKISSILEVARIEKYVEAFDREDYIFKTIHDEVF